MDKCDLRYVKHDLIWLALQIYSLRYILLYLYRKYVIEPENTAYMLNIYFLFGTNILY